MEKKHCKWYNDEFCTNGDSPCVADYCPVVEYPELCKCREEDLANEKKLTDEEIIKALLYCQQREQDCEKCYLHKAYYPCLCHRKLLFDTLDLIHRLQDENKRLSLIAGMIDKGVAVEIVNMQETIDMQKAEIELLTEELEKAYEIERANIKAEIADAGTSCHWCQNQTVKDTAKEIWEKSKHFYKQYPLSTEVGFCCFRDWLKKRYGVEVE